MIDLNSATVAELTEGTEVAYSKLVGYKMIQNRPFECRPICKCGTCNGTTTKHTSTVKRVQNYMDNSVEVKLADGHNHMLVAPHGDVCF